MSTKVILPKQGLQMTEGKILKWLVREGEKVQKGKPLFEMETDKLTIDIDSPETGTLLKIIRLEGETVPITELIAVIGEDGEDLSDILSVGIGDDKDIKSVSGSNESARLISMEEGVPFEEVPEGAEDKLFSTPRARMRAEELSISIKSIKGTGPEGLIIERDVLNYSKQQSGVAATPLAKKIAQINNIELNNIKGTGAVGKVTRVDVEKAIGEQAEEKVICGRSGKLIPFTGMRKVIARRMVDSLHIAAQANHRMNVDMTEVLRLKERLKDNGVKVSITDILVKITSYALREHKIVNSTFTDEGILVLDDINIGVAVALDSGLVVPVVKNADMLSLVEINKTSGGLSEKAKSGTLKPEDTSGGTFTVSNLGMYDIDSITAIINQPESAILAVGKINKTYIVVDDQPVIKPILTLSLTYDHRVIDGAPAAKFLYTFKKIVENPYLLI